MSQSGEVKHDGHVPGLLAAGRLRARALEPDRLGPGPCSASYGCVAMSKQLISSGLFPP